MKFAHMSDIHLGVWSSHPELKELAVQAFEKVIDRCTEEEVDFIIIAGDLFDTSLPPIDVVKRAAAKFRVCKEKGIRVYAVPGSHDFSPTGKTMLGVFEEAGLLKNVAQLEESEGRTRLVLHQDESGAVLAGMAGKKGALETMDFENLEKNYEGTGFRIFVFHSAVLEYRPDHMKEMRAVSLERLPYNFDYYAAGHIHMRHADEEHKVFFPSSVFPCDFDELEKNQNGFFLVETEGKGFRQRWLKTTPFETVVLKLQADGMTPQEVESWLLEKIEEHDLSGSIVLIKLTGTLDGRQSDINFKAVSARALEKGAIAVKRNVHLAAKELEEVSVKPHASMERLEREIIMENPPPRQLFGLQKEKEEMLVTELMALFKDEKQEDETNNVFEERVKENAKKVLGI